MKAIRNEAIKTDNINAVLGAKSIYPSKNASIIPKPPNLGVGCL